MEFIRHQYNIKPQHHGCVATIGNFDGVHLGHQHLLQQLITTAKLLNLPMLLITFEPLALEYFTVDKVPPRLMRLREKLMVLRNYPINRVLCLKFNAQLANLTAEDFIKTILVQQLGIRYLIVGDDFQFGKQRQGNWQLLQQLGEQYNFQVSRSETFLLAGERVGSSRVRAALANGDLVLAKQLLGRPYSMSGHVVHGDKRGQQLGFPTANIALNRLVSPVNGVFAVKVHGFTTKAWPAVANIGNRPTVDGKRRFLEVHLFDFNKPIYGQFLEIEFVQKIRDEQRFASLDLLKAQIEQDIHTAQQILSQSKFG